MLSSSPTPSNKASSRPRVLPEGRVLPQLWVTLTPEAASRAQALPPAESNLTVALKLVVLSAAVVRTVFLLSSKRMTYGVALGARTVASSASPLGANGSLLYSDVDSKIISTRPHQHFLLPFQRASLSNYPQRRTVQTGLRIRCILLSFHYQSGGLLLFQRAQIYRAQQSPAFLSGKERAAQFGVEDRRETNGQMVNQAFFFVLEVFCFIFLLGVISGLAPFGSAFQAVVRKYQKPTGLDGWSYNPFLIPSIERAPTLRITITLFWTIVEVIFFLLVRVVAESRFTCQLQCSLRCRSDLCKLGLMFCGIKWESYSS